MNGEVKFQPRFSDYNGQGLLKASVQLDLTCESQLAQMEPRYKLPLSYFVNKGLRWHVDEFNIKYHKVIRSQDEIIVKTNVTELQDCAMVVSFEFMSLDKNTSYTSGKVRFLLVDKDDKDVILSEEIVKHLKENGNVS